MERLKIYRRPTNFNFQLLFYFIINHSLNWNVFPLDYLFLYYSSFIGTMQPRLAWPPLGYHVGGGWHLPAANRWPGLCGSLPIHAPGTAFEQLWGHQWGGQQGVLSGEGHGENGKWVGWHGVQPSGLPRDGHLHPVICGWSADAVGRSHCEDANHEGLTLH